MIKSEQKTISAGMITTTPGWRRLLETASDRSTYRIIHRFQSRELGYLHLLEKIIKPPRFRQLCPLVAPINTDFIDYFISQVPKVSLKPLLYNQDQSKLCRLLWRHYCHYQLHLAKHNWPAKIGNYIDDFLKQVAKLTAISPEEWHFHRLYLNIRYGLSGNLPVNKKKELFSTVLQKANIDSPDFNKAAVNQWNTKSHNALASNTVLPHLETIAGAFHNSHEKKWIHFLELADSSGEKLPERYTDLSLNSGLSTLISPRTANALEGKGIYTFKDLKGVTEEDIRSISNLGITSVTELKFALHQVMQVIEQRARIKRQELEQQKKLARQFEQQRIVQNK